MEKAEEIRAKSLELAIGLLGVLTIPKNQSLNVADAQLYVKDVAELALSFEELISEASPG